PGYNALANGVNGAGVIVGQFSSATAIHAALWQNDAAHTSVDLGTLPGDVQGNAWGVNDAGQIVGVSSNSLVEGAAGRAVLYQNGAMYDLASLVSAADGTWALDRAVAINNLGWIIAVGAKSGVSSAVVLMPEAVSCAPLTITQNSLAGAVVQTGFSAQVSAT